MVVDKNPKKKLVKVRGTHNCNFSASKKGEGSQIHYINIIKVLPFLCVVPTLTIALWAILPLQSCTVPLSVV